MTVNLLHLFPEELSSSGDVGNVQAVAHRFATMGHNVEIVTWDGRSDFPADIDAVFIGNGPWSAAVLLRDALAGITNKLLELRDSGTPIFAVGMGAELLSREIISPEGETFQGIGLFPMTVQREADRRVGYMRIDSRVGELIGFGDFASAWTIGDGATALGKAVVGDRPQAVFSEGCRVENALATRLGGPAIPLNPALGLEIVNAIARRRSFAVAETPLAADEYAREARELILKNLDSVFTTIAL